MPMLHNEVVNPTQRSQGTSAQRTMLRAWRRATRMLMLTPLASGVAMALASPSWGQETIDGAPQQERSANTFDAAVYQQWWFDVELIVFTRETPVDNASEQFSSLDLSAPQDFTPRLPYEFDPITLWAQQTQTQPVEQLVRRFQWCSGAQQLDTRLSTVGLTQVTNDRIAAAAKGLFQLPPMVLEPIDLTFHFEQLACDPARMGLTQPLPVHPIKPIDAMELIELGNQALFDGVSVRPSLPAAQLLNLPLKPSLVGHDALRYGQAENTNSKPSVEQFQLGLLPASEYKHTEIVEGLEKSPDTQPILHIAWRQEIKFNPQANPYWRIHGGYRYPLPFKYPERPVKNRAVPAVSDMSTTTLDAQSERDTESQAQIIERVLSALTDNESVSGPSTVGPENSLTHENMRIEEMVAKQLEGRLKIFLQYVDKVPYLHIDSQLKRLKPIVTGDGEEQWLQIEFNQRRRVISSQLHYFDHPHLGVLIEIRRFSIPSF